MAEKKETPARKSTGKKPPPAKKPAAKKDDSKKCECGKARKPFPPKKK